MTGSTIEIADADGALNALETWLRGHGFFVPGGESLIADVYLGYGLSAMLRRNRDSRATRALPPASRCRRRPAVGV